MITLIEILVIFISTSVLIAYLVVKITLLTRKLKCLETDINTVLKDIENTAQRMTSGNVGHCRGSITNMCNYFKVRK